MARERGSSSQDLPIQKHIQLAHWSRSSLAARWPNIFPLNHRDSSFALYPVGGECDAVLKYFDGQDSFEHFARALEIQIYLSKNQMSPPILFFGNVLGSEELATTVIGYYLVGAYARPYSHCSEPKMNKFQIVNRLAELSIVHNDLDTGDTNLVCFQDRAAVIDFDYADDLRSLSSEERIFKIELEKMCTLNLEPSWEFENSLTEFSRAQIQSLKKFSLPYVFLEICLCRKAVHDPQVLEVLVASGSPETCQSPYWHP